MVDINEVTAFIERHYANPVGREIIANLQAKFGKEAPPVAAPVAGGVEEYPLSARIWKRESTQEWVLEVEGAINNTAFTCRHTEPLTTPPERVAGLPGLYHDACLIEEEVDISHLGWTVYYDSKGAQPYPAGVVYPPVVYASEKDARDEIAKITSFPQYYSPAAVYVGKALVFSTQETKSPEVSNLSLAAIGREHFGNPIPQAWYAAARDLLAVVASGGVRVQAGDTVMRALKESRDIAMNNTVAARIPECGDFSRIAQDLDWAIQQIEETDPGLKNEAWMVIQKRSDGSLPDPVKGMFAKGNQALHFGEDDALAAMKDVNDSLGGNFAGVFRCLIEVVEPVHQAQ